MKVFFVTLLALMLSVSALTGCRSGSTEDTRPEVTEHSKPENTTKADDHVTIPMTTPEMSRPEETAGENGMVPQESENGGQSGDARPGETGGETNPGDLGRGNRSRFRSRLD